MTKLNTINDDTNTTNGGARVRNRKTDVVAPVTTILLKSLHDTIIRNNPTSTLTTKILRTWLRANMNEAHTHNASWVFNDDQVHVVRMKFDAKYRAMNEKQAKAATRKPRAKKVAVVETPVVA